MVWTEHPIYNLANNVVLGNMQHLKNTNLKVSSKEHTMNTPYDTCLAGYSNSIGNALVTE